MKNKMTKIETKTFFKQKNMEDLLVMKTPTLKPTLDKKGNFEPLKFINQTTAKLTEALLQAEDNVLLQWVAEKEERFIVIIYNLIQNKEGMNGAMYVEYLDKEPNLNVLEKHYKGHTIKMIDRKLISKDKIEAALQFHKEFIEGRKNE